MLAQDFPGVTIDETLVKLENPQTFPGFVDPRHCLCFWARPTSKVRSLVTKVQNKLLEIAPSQYSLIIIIIIIHIDDASSADREHQTSGSCHPNLFT